MRCSPKFPKISARSVPKTTRIPIQTKMHPCTRLIPLRVLPQTRVAHRTGSQHSQRTKTRTQSRCIPRPSSKHYSGNSEDKSGRSGLRPADRSDSADVGKVDLEQQSTPMEKRKRILSREAPRDEFINRHFVSPDSTRRAVNSPQLCSRSSHGFHVDGDRMQSVEVVYKSDSGPGGHGTTTSNATDNTSHVAKIGHTPVLITQAMTVLLCWKAASRWTETAELRREQFLSVNSNEIIIYWGRFTKTTRLNPYRPYMYAIITGPGTNQIAQYVSSLRPGQRMSTATVQEMDLHIRDVLGDGYGTHSIKRGAITFLFQEIVEGHLNLSEVMNLSKHLNVESLLRYNANQITTARALGTQKVSVLLPGASIM